MPNNNDIINRPFRDLQERLADADRMERLDNTEQKGVDYRAISNFLSGEIQHLVNTTSDPKVKE